LIEKVYIKERGLGLTYFGLELDELWSFVGKKENKQWVWLALNPANSQIVGFHVGGRGKDDAKLFYDKIPDFFKQKASFFSDYWQAYVSVFADENHFGIGKDSGLTAHIERFNCTLRQRNSRLVRKTLSFSKSLKNHINSFKHFICDYNLKIKSSHL
jgi:insertion element IS1 protein InsB